MTICYNRLKSIRDSWDRNNTDVASPIIDIGGNDYRTYDFIMRYCNEVIVETIPNLVLELLKAYGIESTCFDIFRNDAHVFIINQTKAWPECTRGSNKQKVFAIKCLKDTYDDTLYIFKEFGLANTLPNTLIYRIMSENGLEKYCYISLVEDSAYKEQLNQNNNTIDSSRDTYYLSLKNFFETFFDKNEYETFKRYADEFTNKVKKYYGFKIIRNLKPNTMSNHREYVRDNIYKFNVAKIDKDGKLSEKQREFIEKHFFVEKTSELLIGSSDFAQSYMTAEWLFSSLNQANKMDLTPIVMSYFKSVEQLLFDYIKLHTYEKDNAPTKRKIYTGNKTEDLVDALMANKDKTDRINLGAITRFFGEYYKDTNNYVQRNTDLLYPEIYGNTQTYYLIIDAMYKITNLRNTFLHRENLYDWDKVNEVRDSTQFVFYLFLGAYKITNQDKQDLGSLNDGRYDDYFKLCDYMNKKAYEIGLRIPIFYLDVQTDPNVYWCVNNDNYIEYDQYGEPTYSGVYFRKLANKDTTKIITKENLPREIWEGALNISKDTPIKNEPTGPINKIFSNGKFLI